MGENLSFFGGFGQQHAAGLVVLSTEAGKVRYVHGNAAAGGKPVVLAYGEAEWRGDAHSLAQAYKAFGFGRRNRCATLVMAGDYQISAVEAPNVPDAELKAAMRWRMKDVIDYPVEQAVYDLLEIPAGAGGGAAGRTRWIYVVAARAELIKTYVERFDEARVPLGVIDIPETAQRNVAALYERDARGVGLLYFDDAGGLLTVTSGGELYLARRFDFTMTQIRQNNEAYREDLYGRILVELQRTLDNFERQHSQIVLSRIMLGPEPAQTPLAAYLRGNLGVEVAPVALEEVLEFRGTAPDAQVQWKYFHLIGCAIRSEGMPQ